MSTSIMPSDINIESVHKFIAEIDCPSERAEIVIRLTNYMLDNEQLTDCFDFADLQQHGIV